MLYTRVLLLELAADVVVQLGAVAWKEHNMTPPFKERLSRRHWMNRDAQNHGRRKLAGLMHTRDPHGHRKIQKWTELFVINPPKGGGGSGHDTDTPWAPNGSFTPRNLVPVLS